MKKLLSVVSLSLLISPVVNAETFTNEVNQCIEEIIYFQNYEQYQKELNKCLTLSPDYRRGY